MIIKCPECGHQVSDRAKTCPSCGVDIVGKVTRCPDCGEYIFKDDHECPNCHCSINAAAPESNPSSQNTQSGQNDQISQNNLIPAAVQPDVEPQVVVGRYHRFCIGSNHCISRYLLCSEDAEGERTTSL